jgi:hypothetical protein
MSNLGVIAVSLSLTTKKIVLMAMEIGKRRMLSMSLPLSVSVEY